MSPGKLTRWALPTLADVLFLLFFLGLLLAEEGPARFLPAEDTGWHLAAGERILREGAIPRSDPFSYTRSGAPWVAYEYLSEIFMAGSWWLAGLNGVVALAAALIAATIAGLYRILRRQGNALGVSLVVSLAAVVPVAVHWLARPHLVSMLFVLLFADRLDRHVRGEPARLWTLPLWLALWVQFHGGFLLGIILTGAALAGLSLGRTLGGAGHPSARPLAVCFAAMLPMVLVHPDGGRLPGYLVRYLGSRFIFDHNLEFSSADFHDPQILFFGAWLIVFFGLAALGRYRPRLPELLPPLALIALALYAARHVPYAAIAGSPLLARMLDAALPRRIEIAERAGRFEARLKGGLWSAAGLSVVAALLAGGGWSRLGLPNFDFHPRLFPVKAVAFIDSSDLGPRMFNPDNWGGYLIYRLHPRFPVFIDGRQDMYGEAFVREYWEAARAGRGWAAVLDRHRVDWVVWPADEALCSVLDAHPQWRLAYEDETSCLYERLQDRGRH